MALQTGFRDPIDHRLAILGKPRIVDKDSKSAFKQDTGRMARVIEEVRDKSQWNKKRKAGRKLGFSNHYSFYSYVAMVAEVITALLFPFTWQLPYIPVLAQQMFEEMNKKTHSK